MTLFRYRNRPYRPFIGLQPCASRWQLELLCQELPFCASLQGHPGLQAQLPGLPPCQGLLGFGLLPFYPLKSSCLAGCLRSRISQGEPSAVQLRCGPEAFCTSGGAQAKGRAGEARGPASVPERPTQILVSSRSHTPWPPLFPIPSAGPAW